jgi:hypothetical protein
MASICSPYQGRPDLKPVSNKTPDFCFRSQTAKCCINIDISEEGIVDQSVNDAVIEIILSPDRNTALCAADIISYVTFNDV